MSDHGRNCGTCRNWHRTTPSEWDFGGPVSGECRAQGPSFRTGGWPSVTEEKWCGKWKMDSKPMATDRIKEALLGQLSALEQWAVATLPASARDAVVSKLAKKRDEIRKREP